MELFTNAPHTTLNGAILSTDLIIVVNSSAGFPTSGNFRVLIENEIIEVTTVAGTSWTVTRGTEGTTAVDHADAISVDGIWTSAAMNAFRSDNQQLDTYVNRPAAGTKGVIYRSSDSLYVDRDNGTAWDSFGPVYNLKPPASVSFSWANQGSATIENTKGYHYLHDSGSTGGVKIRYVAVPSAPYTLTLGFIPHIWPSNFQKNGICLYDTVSTKVLTFGFHSVSLTAYPGFNYEALKWNTPTSFNSSYGAIVAHQSIGSLIFVQIHDDGTNRNLNWGMDGIHFHTFFTQVRTDFLTPDSIGFYIDTTGNPNGMTVVHWG